MSNTGPLFQKTEIAREAEPLPPGWSDTKTDRVVFCDDPVKDCPEPPEPPELRAQLLEFSERLTESKKNRTAPTGQSDTLDQLWREAAAKGSLQVQSRRDSRGEYIRAVCERTNRTRLVCTAATLDAALRAIANWGNQRYFRIERGIGGIWRPWEFETYANEIAAEEVVAAWRKTYKGEFRFVAVEP